ncbi:MAG: amino acid racemase [Candidatus Bathyarchaeota archaeon]|nr:amino acid racemase [Candidatus Bathyarchaeota archaeon]
MSKRIGLLGGISYASTKEYYELIHRRYFELKQDYYYPEVVVFSLNFQKFTDYENTDTTRYIEYIMEGIHSLEATQVDFIAMTANSPHSVYKSLIKQTKVPLISIADATLKTAKELKLKRLLLLGIKHTMDADFYPEAGTKNGVSVTVPTEAEKKLIDDIIFSELCIGEINQGSKEKLLAIIDRYPVDGVILGCTELPQIISQDDLDIAVLNTVEIHVEAILQHSLE